jgi:hypothetical protein
METFMLTSRGSLAAAILALSLSSCVLRTSGGRIVLDTPTAGTMVAAAAAAPGPNEDQHWFHADDYLVVTAAHGSHTGATWQLAKMTQAPSSSTRSEGQFLTMHGQSVWTAHFARTRVAVAADLRVGQVVFSAWYGKPFAKKEESRNGSWWQGTIADTSDLYKNLVSVSGKNCEANALRVPLQ